MASQTTVETPNPKTLSSDYREMADYWKMVTAILAGVEALRQPATYGAKNAVAGPAVPYASLSQLNVQRRGRSGAESLYLPQFPQEENGDYDYRRKHSPLTNIYTDISKNLSSKPFSKNLELDEKTADDLKKLAMNIDGQTNSLHVFSADVFKAGIDYGIDWIWVDYPKINKPISLADERNMGARPYWVRVPATHLLAVYSDFINGQEVFIHARIYEPSSIRDGFSEKFVERVRVLNREPMIDPVSNEVTAYGPPTWQLFELVEQENAQTRKKETSWTLIDSGDITIGIIPLVPFKTGKRDGNSWKIMPPLKDIAWLQIEEFQQESNLKNIKELTAFPMLAGNGVSPTNEKGESVTIKVGPHAVLFAPPQMDGRAVGSWSYIEPGASSMSFLQTSLENLRTEMRDLGMQPLTTSNLTVITTANVSMKVHNQVQAWALGLKDALEQAWIITCMWLNRPDEKPVVRVHTDFGVDFESGSELTALQSMRTNKDLSQLTFWEEFKRRGTLSDDFDPDIETERLADEQANDVLTPETHIDPVTGMPIVVQPKPGVLNPPAQPATKPIGRSVN